MSRILLDTTRCAGLGVCEAAAPTAFEVTDDGVLTVLVSGAVPAAELESVRGAVDSCPMEALELTDD